MKELKLYNTAHPLADTGKPIFIPFGEWKYDATRRQRLDRAHGERIANELNARIARGDPGIPVYQGHPDVPELAAKYPDKGALGWVTRIDIVNELTSENLSTSQPFNHSTPREGLALTVEWDRDPGKGFKWFSPYWFANEVERDGVTYIVSEISSIGLVNNPNIPEFRLANETNPTATSPKSLAPTILSLAEKYDRLANEANFDESKHPRAEDGKFTDSGGAGGGTLDDRIAEQTREYLDALNRGLSPEPPPEMRARGEAMQRLRKSASYQSASGERKKFMLDTETQRVLRKNLYTSLEKKVGTGMALELFRTTGLSELDIHGDPAKVERAAHRAAILSGLTYNRSTHQYE